MVNIPYMEHMGYSSLIPIVSASFFSAAEGRLTPPLDCAPPAPDEVWRSDEGSPWYPKDPLYDVVKMWLNQ